MLKTEHRSYFQSQRITGRPFFLHPSSDYSVHDFGDLKFNTIEEDEPYMDVKSPRNVGAANKMLSGAVSQAVGAGYTLVMLGGDHR